MSGTLLVITVLAVLCGGLFFRLLAERREAKSLASRIRATDETLEEKVRSALEEKNRIAAILESMTEGVLVIDQDENVSLVNPSFKKAFGLERIGTEDRHYWEVIRDKDINGMIGEAMRSKVPMRSVHAVTLPDAVFEVQVSPVRNGSEFAGVVAVFFDVSRLQELERLRSEFVANVSHELKTPLTSILGFVETLKEGAIEDVENRGRFLDIIENHSKKLQTLIEDLLFLSKLESEKGAIRKQPVELAILLDRLMELFARPLAEKKMNYEKKIPQGFRMDVEPVLIERVLSNLLDNAVKYGENGGSLLVSAGSEKGETVIRVFNTGPKVAEEELARVFERFYRIERSRSRESGGTGLGLSIVKHAVERHGGRVTAANAVQGGPGVVFTVHLPSNGR